VDGNVYRVLARHFGIDLPVNTPAGQRYFREQAERVMDPERPGDYNQAIMEFGALQCVPGKPDCGNCPLNRSCAAFTANQVGALPNKQPKPRPRKRYFHYIMPVDPAFRTYLRQRDQRGIWQGLYEFPLLERKAPPDLPELSEALALATDTPPPEIIKKVRFNPRPIVHKLSHQHLHTTFWIVYVDALPKASTPIAEMGKFPVPVLISEFMDTVKNSYF
jgi:A/G-specific adenine glycosylase